MNPCLALPLLAALLTQAPTPPVLTLDEALSRADRQNLDLAAARARLAQSQTLSRKAWSGYLPQVNASGTYTYNSTEAKFGGATGYYVRDVGVDQGPPFDPANPGLGAPTPYTLVPAGFIEQVIQKQHQLTGTVQATQALVVPALWAQIKSAYLAEDVAELSVENARREILFAVAQAYYGAEGLRESVEVQERMMESFRKHERDAELGVQAGTAPQIALLRAQIQRTQAEQDLLRTRNALSSALSALATLLDTEPGFTVTRPPAPAPLPEGEDLAAAALKDRPDLAAARGSVELNGLARRGVFYRYAPTLALFARYNIQNSKGFTGEYGSWTAGLSLNWTLWDGGLREAELEETEQKIAESRATLRAAENRAKDEIRRAGLDLDSAEANRLKAEEQVRLAKRNAELVGVAFEAGTATSLETVDANTALRGAELTLINEQLNAQLAALRLAKAAGRFAPAAKETP